jgi:hypothetical protein
VLTDENENHEIEAKFKNGQHKKLLAFFNDFFRFFKMI